MKPKSNTTPTTGALIARNTVLNLIGFSLPLVAAVFCIPVVVAKLGLQMFGILALAWVINNYALMFDLGVTQAIIKFISELRGQLKTKEEASILWSGVCIQALMSVFGLVVIILASSPLAWHMLRDTPDLIEEARNCFFIMAFSVPAILISNSFRGFLEAFQRFDMVNAVKVPVNLSVFLIPLLGALAQWKLSEIMIAMTLFRYFGLGAYMWFAAFGRPGIFDMKYIGQFGQKFGILIRYGKWVAVSSIIGPILVYSERFFIGALVSASAVAYYSAPHEMITRLSIITMSLLTALFPEFSHLYSAGNMKRIFMIISSVLKYIILFVGPILIVIVFYSGDILFLWLGANYADNSKTVLQVLALGIFVNSLAYLPFYLLRAAGRPDLPAKIHLLELPVYVSLLIVLIKAYGIQGAAFAWTARCAVDAILLYVASHRVTGLSLSSLSEQRIHILVFCFIVTCGLSALVGTLKVGFVISLVLLGVVITGFYLVSWTWVIKASLYRLRHNKI